MSFRLEKLGVHPGLGWRVPLTAIPHGHVRWRRPPRQRGLPPMSNESANGLVWDADLASALVRKVLLVGLTVESAGAKAPQKHQFYGTVLSADHRTGIALSLLGNRSGESYILPPDTRAIHLAASGNRLRATGEMVVDPDFTATFSVTGPARA